MWESKNAKFNGNQLPHIRVDKDTVNLGHMGGEPRKFSLDVDKYNNGEYRCNKKIRNISIVHELSSKYIRTIFNFVMLELLCLFINKRNDFILIIMDMAQEAYKCIQRSVRHKWKN